MTAKIIDGKKVAQHSKQILQQTIEKQQPKASRPPKLVVLLIGSNPASEIYVRNKHKSCEQVGIRSETQHLPADISETQLLEKLTQLNRDPEVDGILVQLPLPAHINEPTILESINPQKDVDGFHPYNMGRLLQRHPLLRPCTPFGIIQLLQYYQLPIRGQHAVVVGASNIVGRPLGLELLLEAATVTTCHSATKNLAQHVAQADILVVATGKRDAVKAQWIKPQSVVIDVGIHRLADGSLCGDVDFNEAREKAAWITPVPGGVGPMTVATLLKNTVTAWQGR
jgi:methylenetetrahydrofolate dehydrogenase (NADP+)/methenyltetrahydrofolate cyclohydrolase